MPTQASDPLFDPPTIFVPEKADLELPEHPNPNTTWFCVSKAERIYDDLHVGVNPNEDVSDANPPRILSRYMLPYLQNLRDVADELDARAKYAEETFLQSAIDAQFDRHMLVTTIAQVRDYRNAVYAYYQLAGTVEDLPDLDQVDFLNDHVLKPVFTGSGFAVIGDDESPWITFTPSYCEGIKLGIDLDAAVKGHSLKWQEMGRDPTKEGTSNKRSFGAQGLGLLGLVIIGAMLAKK